MCADMFYVMQVLQSLEVKLPTLLEVDNKGGSRFSR